MGISTLLVLYLALSLLILLLGAFRKVVKAVLLGALMLALGLAGVHGLFYLIGMM